MGRAKTMKKGMRQAVGEHKSSDQTAVICRRHGEARAAGTALTLPTRGLTSYITPRHRQGQLYNRHRLTLTNH